MAWSTFSSTREGRGASSWPTIAKYRILGKTGPPAVDWGRYNINVNCITPGVKHPLTRRTIAAWATPEQINERIPLAYMGESRGSG